MTNSISEDYSTDIINNIDYDLIKYSDRGVLRYGLTDYTFNLISNTIPNYLKQLCLDLKLDNIKSVTINKYRTNDYISNHKDLGESDIYILSLLSDCDIIFTHEQNNIKFKLPCNSLFRLTGVPRKIWYHRIDKILSDRISIVFR